MVSAVSLETPTPFALSLSKGFPFFCVEESKSKGFDSPGSSPGPNGFPGMAYV